MENDLRIIAGPCSINWGNMDQVREIAEMPGIAGVRVVDLKSRTEFKDSPDAMGIGLDAYRHNRDLLRKGGSIADMIESPGVELGRDILMRNGLLIIASEIMNPLLQLGPVARDRIFAGAFMPWNASVNQLMWNVNDIAQFAMDADWEVGVKNGKTYELPLAVADRHDYMEPTEFEKGWAGLASGASGVRKINLIHRGVNVPERFMEPEDSRHRNLPVHVSAERTLDRVEKMMQGKDTEVELWWDPSHALGPKLRNSIVAVTIEAMKMRRRDGRPLYKGILIEAGASTTDTDQHITIPELRDMLLQLGEFRNLIPAKNNVR